MEQVRNTETMDRGKNRLCNGHFPTEKFTERRINVGTCLNMNILRNNGTVRVEELRDNVTVVIFADGGKILGGVDIIVGPVPGVAG